MKTILISFCLAMVAMNAHAKPVISYDANFVYVKHSLQDLTEEQQKMAIDASIDLTIDKMARLIKAGQMPLSINSENLEELASASENLSSYIAEVDKSEVFKKSDKIDTEAGNLVPSAIFVGVGTKLSINALASAAGSVTLGFVIMPSVVHKIPRYAIDQNVDVEKMDIKQIAKAIENETTTSKMSFDWEVIGWPNVDVGVGAGSPINGVIRMSAGFVWGPMEDAGDFSGMAIGGSGTATALGGANAKIGAVHNFSKPGFFQYKYFIGSVEFGPKVEASWHVNAVSGVITGEKVLRFFDIDPDVIRDAEVDDNGRVVMP